MQHEDVTAVVWQDKCVILLSTNFDPPTDGSVTKKTGKGNEEIEIVWPQAGINYTKHLGGVDVSDVKREYCGVDVSDQKREYCGVDVSDQKREYCGVDRSSKKWWKFILHFVLNMCLVNCFILYDLSNHPPSTAHGNRQLTFRRTWCVS
jgi:hypothetical protein